MFELYLWQKLYRFLNSAVRWTLIIKMSEMKMIRMTNPNKHPPMIPIPRDDVLSSVALCLVRAREERFRTGTAPSWRTFSRWGLIMLRTSSGGKSFRNSHLLTLGSSLSVEKVKILYQAFLHLQRIFLHKRYLSSQWGLEFENVPSTGPLLIVKLVPLDDTAKQR